MPRLRTSAATKHLPALAAGRSSFAYGAAPAATLDPRAGT
jgi:hypothetical protein